MVLHPFLFALYPVLQLSLALSPDVSFVDAWRAAALLTFFALLSVIGLRAVLGDWQRAGYLTTLVLFALVYYGSIHLHVWDWSVGGLRVGQHAFFLPLWLLLLGGMGYSWRWLTRPEIVTAFLNLMSVVALALSGGRYVWRLQQVRSEPTATPPLSVSAGIQEESLDMVSRHQPDVYYIVPDGYARADVLTALYGSDNAEFLDELRARGFYVADGSRSNYVQTLLSLSSSLNLGYLIVSHQTSENRDPLTSLARDSLVRRSLDGAGYQVVAVQSSYPPVDWTDADVFLRPRQIGRLNPFEELLLMKSLASVLYDHGLATSSVTGYSSHRALVLHAIETLGEVADLPGPKFVFYHVVAPHPPFVLDREGAFVQPEAPFWGLSDGSHFQDTPQAYREGYSEVLPYLNRMLLEAIDAILEQSSEPPIIILQADHGPGSLLDWESAEETCHWERSSILNAYYLPGDGAAALYPTITPVNTFRVIFDAYFGTSLGLLEDRSYYSRWSAPYDFVDITDAGREGCAIP